MKTFNKAEKEKVDMYMLIHFPSTVIKFLWNTENIYRYRVNTIEDKSITSSFIHVVVEKDKITHTVK